MGVPPSPPPGDDHVLHATTIILVSGALSWSCRKKMVPKTKSSAEKKVVPKKKIRAEKTDVVKKKLDEKN